MRRMEIVSLTGDEAGTVGTDMSGPITGENAG